MKKDLIYNILPKTYLKKLIYEIIFLIALIISFDE